MDALIAKTRAGLLEHVIETQALAHRMLNTSAEHCDQAREVKALASPAGTPLRGPQLHRMSGDIEVCRWPRTEREARPNGCATGR